MKPLVAAIIAGAALAAAPALAAPKLDNLVVKPAAGKGAEVEVSVSIARTRFDTGGCDARVEFGDGEGRTMDFGVAATRTVKHAYRKNGSYNVSVKGSGATPCEGTRQAPVKIAGVLEKKADKKKAEPTKKKGAGKKKADEKK